MGALTKAEMAERLYEELGLNKKRWSSTNRSSSRGSAILICAISVSAPVAILKQGRKFRLRLAVS